MLVSVKRFASRTLGGHESILIAALHYPLIERMTTLEFQAVSGWSLEQTACTFQVTAEVVGSG